MDYSKMKYNDLKAEAKNQGLDASGTKEELIARLSGSGEKPPAPAKKSDAKPSDEADENADEDEDSEDDSEEDSKPAKPVAKKAVSAPKQTATQLHRTRALRMKEHLDKQPKVRVLIPFNSGETPEQAKKIPFHVNINGWTMDVPRGVMVDVPEQVAQMVYERLESEGRIGSQYRIDSDEKRLEALS